MHSSLYQEPHQEHRGLLSSVAAATTVAYSCLLLDMIGLLCGLTIFMKRVNLFQSVVHFCGSVLTCWFVRKLQGINMRRYLNSCSLFISPLKCDPTVYAMDANSLWMIVGLTNIPTALVELLVLVSQYYTKTPTYW